MKNSSEGYNNRETELNLVDLSVYYMKRWKSLFVLLVIMAVIGSVAGLYMRTQKAGDTEEDIRNYSISASVKADMDNAYSYQKLYDTQMEYTENSVYMNLDYSRVYTGALRYVVYVGADASTTSIGWQIVNILSDEETRQQLMEVVGCTEDAYLREIVGTTLEYPSATAPDGTTVVSSNNLTTSFWFYAPDEATGQAMIDIVEEKADTLIEAYLAINEGYTIQKSEESITPQVNTIIRDQQSANTNLLSTYSTSLNKLKGDFTKKQQSYYDVVYLGKEVSQKGVGSAIKYIFAGMCSGVFLGILLWLCYGFLSYLSDRHVKYAGEMRHYYGLRLIGRYWPQELASDKIEKWYENIRSKKLGSSNDENYLASVLQIQGENLCLVGSTEDEIVRTLGEKLTLKNEHAVCGDLLQRSSETLEHAKKADGVVLLVHRGISTYQEIRRELEICSIQEIQVLGAIMIE